MNVLIIHKHGRDHGSGGVISTYRLHRGLQAAGIDSTIACRVLESDRPDVVELPRADRLERWLGRVTWRLGLNDVHCVSSFRLKDFEPWRRADLVNIHGWHTDFFSYLAVPRLSRDRPLVTSLHDMWNFTGHCAYSGSCRRWQTGCGRCPQPEAFPCVPRDATGWEWRLKRWVYRRSEMIVTTPSRWLAEVARTSILGRFPIRFVPNGVDTETFRPRDRDLCRAALEIPDDRHVVMFAAAAIDDHRKGMDLLLEALHALPAPMRRQTTLLVIGDRGRHPIEVEDVTVLELGYVFDDRLKALCYNAADLFVFPTRDEVQGRVLLEAMACGTPCVAFRVGGVPETVIDGRTGALAEPESADDLRAGMVRLLEDEATRDELGRSARQFVLDQHTVARHVAGFIDVYREALGQSTAQATTVQLDQATRTPPSSTRPAA